MKIKNNINKNIGKVVYIVEGDNDEPKLIIDIFQKIFNYSIVRYDKLNDKIVELKQDNNKYSKVYIIPAKYSAISTLDISDDYFDEIFSKLSKYDLDIDNSALYFLFDRDRQSNRPGVIKKNMSHFYNSIFVNGFILFLVRFNELSKSSSQESYISFTASHDALIILFKLFQW